MSGLSAVGYITFMLAMDPRWLGRFGHSPGELAGAVPLSGQATSHFRLRYYAEDGRSEDGTMDVINRLRQHGKYLSPRIDEMAPLWHVKGDLPPMVVVVGQSPWEMQARAEENRLLVETCRQMGDRQIWFVELPYMDHDGAFLCGVPCI